MISREAIEFVNARNWSFVTETGNPSGCSQYRIECQDRNRVVVGPTPHAHRQNLNNHNDIQRRTPVTTYRDIEIVYDETATSGFTPSGKDRSAETLLNAKKTIDSPHPRRTGFRRFAAWYRTLGPRSAYRPATVTSMAESTGRFWSPTTEKRGIEHTQAGAHRSSLPATTKQRRNRCSAHAAEGAGDHDSSG